MNCSFVLKVCITIGSRTAVRESCWILPRELKTLPQDSSSHVNVPWTFNFYASQTHCFDFRKSAHSFYNLQTCQASFVWRKFCDLSSRFKQPHNYFMNIYKSLQTNQPNKKFDFCKNMHSFYQILSDLVRMKGTMKSLIRIQAAIQQFHKNS